MNNTIQEIQIKYNPSPKIERTKICNSQDAYKAFMAVWNQDTIELLEEVKIMLLNRDNEVLGYYNLSKGGLYATYVDIKLLFAVVLKAAACQILVCHNHPSGKLSPSEADKKLNKKIQEIAKVLDIVVVDNLIITRFNFFSIN